MTTLTDLPNELISHICYYVHPDDIHSFSAVSRQIYLATSRNLVKHRALQLEFGVLDEIGRWPQIFQFWLNLLHNILLGSPIALYIRRVYTGRIERCQKGYNPLEMTDWEIKEINDGWGYDIDLPRLPVLCPLSVERLNEVVNRDTSDSGGAEIHEDSLRIRAALEQSPLFEPQASTPLNIYR